MRSIDNVEVRIVMLKGEQGDPGTSGDYASLTNKPSINGHTLSGSMTLSELGIMTQTEADDLQEAIGDLNSAIGAVQDDVDAVALRVTTLENAGYATQTWVDTEIDTKIATAVTSAINASY